MDWARVGAEVQGSLRPSLAVLADWLPERQPWRAVLSPVLLVAVVAALYVVGLLVVIALAGLGGPELVVSGDRRYGRDDAVFVGCGAVVLVVGYAALVIWEAVSREWRLSRDVRRYREL